MSILRVTVIHTSGTPVMIEDGDILVRYADDCFSVTQTNVSRKVRRGRQYYDEVDTTVVTRSFPLVNVLEVRVEETP